MKKQLIKLQFLGLMFIPAMMSAQDVNSESAANSSSIFSNPLFLTLLGVMLVLALLIGVLGKTIVNLLRYKYKLSGKTKGVATLLLLGTLLLDTQNALAAGSADIAGINPTAFWFIVIIIMVELFIISWFILVLYRVFEKEKDTVTETNVVVVETPQKESWLASIWSKLNDFKTIEKEKDILLDHDYDGIKELDNNLPPWWKYGFYFTIIFGIAYLAWFHLMGGPSSSEELRRSIVQAEEDIKAWEAANPVLVDATTVTFMNDASSLVMGRELYIKHNCQTCHGEQGEGNMIGPNLTDEYWKNGGSISHIFATISNGVQGSAMQAWNKNMNSMEIAQLASYIMSLQGTNPPNAKAAEGEKYEPIAETDSEESSENNEEVYTEIIEE
jgi:cytochrome c oxidase cbb3-type subunit 3